MLKYILPILLSLFSYSCTQISNENKVENPINKDSLFITKSVQNVKAGRIIFNKHCSACHNIESCTGINFKDIFKIYQSMSDEHLFEKFIADSKSVKKSGNAYFLKLDKEYNSDYEHLFKDSLSQNEIYNLITYLKIYTK
ncbi:MAG: hypothetical protein RLZZ175_40 [Bacteroidota bacterium]|jgi:cytochrome c2